MRWGYGIWMGAGGLLSGLAEVKQGAERLRSNALVDAALVTLRPTFFSSNLRSRALVLTVLG
jgi:hypothetical protein